MLPRRSNQIYHDVLVAINPGRPCGHQGPTRDPIRTSPSTSWIRPARARASGGPRSPLPQTAADAPPRHARPAAVGREPGRRPLQPLRVGPTETDRPAGVTTPRRDVTGLYISRWLSVRSAQHNLHFARREEKKKREKENVPGDPVQREPGLAGGEPAGDDGAAAAAAAWRGGGGEEGGGGVTGGGGGSERVLPEPRREAAAAGARGQPGGARGRRRGRARRGGRRRRRRRAAGGVRRREAPRRARPAHGRAHLRRARAHSEGGRCTLALNQQRSSDQAVFLFFFFFLLLGSNHLMLLASFFFMALIMVL